MAFAENLREIRERRGFSQNELAEMTELSQSAISKFESGITKPNPRTLKILESALGVTRDELISGKEVKENAEGQTKQMADNKTDA